MKRNIICLLLAASMLLCAGCGKKPEQTEPAPEPQTTEQTEPTEPQTEPTPAEAPTSAVDAGDLARFAPVLDATCDVIYNGVADGEDYPLVPSGVIDAARWQDGTDAAEELGFAFRDVNGDGENELLIGMDESMVFGGFALVNGEPDCFLDGWYRSTYYLLDDGRFLYEGTGGAAYAALGVYHINDDGTDLTCEDFWFTDVAEGTEDDLIVYHNTTGEWDAAASELLELDLDGLWSQIAKTYEEMIADLELTPFSAYAYSGPLNQPLDCKVRLDYEEDVSWFVGECASIGDNFPELAPADDPNEVSVVFRAREDVEDFKLLSLALTDVDEAGNARFEVTELCTLPELKADAPLAVPMTFPGDMPTSGFSYRENGAELQFSVSQSGRDGKLVVVPISGD